MKKRLFLYTTLIIFVGLLSFFTVSVYVTHANNISFAKDAVMETAHICAGLYSENMDISSFVKTGHDTRITIISPDGTVLADSRPLDMATIENHLSRPEIEAAARGFPTAFIRHSDSLGVDFIYYALKVNSSDSYVFMRTAIPIARIDAYLWQSLPLLVIVLCIVSLCSFIFSRTMISRVTKPFESIEINLRSLSNGKYTPGQIIGSYEEINSITQSIDDVAYVLQNSISDLWDEKTKMDYIINNIGDGLFVVDENKNIVIINAAAHGIFHTNPDVAGKSINYLTYDSYIIEAVDDCVNHEKNALFENTLDGRIFFIAVKRLPETKLTMIALSDVTENRENAKRREEFFANASHELKTPLTAIKGFNELTAMHNKDDNIRKYVDSITRETDRMLSLIGDMLQLSELENTETLNPVSVSLGEIVHEVRAVLSVPIEEKAIDFGVFGDATILAEPEHIYELVKNLIENAVRYNNLGGRVTVTIENTKQSTGLYIFDDGIGISPSEQARIFERFYRVEKSRSHRNGGTGLGLSIVKHICTLYNWKLSLKSKLGVGTEVTVIFYEK